MAKIVLINPFTPYAEGINRATITPPLGLAYLAAVLEKNHHQIQIIDANILEIVPDQITNHFHFAPDVVGLSVNIVGYRGAVECAKQIKSVYPGIPIIFGGPYPSSLPETILEDNSTVDAIVLGEGEMTFLELCGSFEANRPLSGLNGIVWRDKKKITRNQERPLIEHLDNIPFPAYHHLPHLRKYKTRGRAYPVGYVITSRGCTYSCAFCNCNIFGKVWRPHSVNRVLEEISFLIRHYGIRQIDVLDDNFTFDKQRASEILEGIVKRGLRLHINLQNGIRIDRTDEELLIKMKHAGVFKVGFGIESASPIIQRETKKIVDLNKAIALTKIAKSLGIITHGFFIIGLPGECADTIKETIRFSLKMNPHFANFGLCIPFPGTELFEKAVEKNLLLEDVTHGIDAGFLGSKVFLKPDAGEPSQMISYVRSAFKSFYFRSSKIIDILSTLRSLGEWKWFFGILKETTMLAVRSFVRSSRTGISGAMSKKMEK